VPTSTNFDDIRRWHNHYGYDGALYSSWSLGQTELRYMAEKPSGAVSLNDFSGKIGYLAKYPSHVGTDNSFKFPGRTKIDLMQNPYQPTYGSTPDNQSIVFGDPMGDLLFMRLQGGGSTWAAIFSSVLFYYDKSRALNISFDFRHTGSIPEREFTVVIVEYQRKFGDSINRVLVSEQIGGPDNTKLQSYSKRLSFDAAYPYKLMSLQNNTGGSGSLSQLSYVGVGNMRITE